jgi:hypothetical protein
MYIAMFVHTIMTGRQLANHRPVIISKSIRLDWIIFTVLRPAGEGLQNFGLCSALRAFEQGGIFIVPHLL